MLSKIIDRFISEDLDEVEKEMIDNLARLSKPESFSTRDEYNSVLDNVFGGGTADYYDRKDISIMSQVARESLPPEMAESFGEIAKDVEDMALNYSKDLHLTNLAVSTAMAVADMTDVTVNPVALLEPYNPSTTAYNIAEILGEQLAEDDGQSDESEDEEDDYGFDDDEYEEY